MSQNLLICFSFLKGEGNVQSCLQLQLTKGVSIYLFRGKPSFAGYPIEHTFETAAWQESF